MKISDIPVFHWLRTPRGSRPGDLDGEVTGESRTGINTPTCDSVDIAWYAPSPEDVMTGRGFSYLDGLTWAEITREERVFCARLHELARDHLPSFVELVSTRDDRECARDAPLDLDPLGHWELAFEACLYRDVLFHRRHPIGDYPGKRTFDLVLLGDDRIVIFEAKAQQGFSTVQLDDFGCDREYVQRLLGVEAVIIGIWSSRYKPLPSTEAVFDGALHWKTLAEHFDGDAMLRRADDVFRR
jgi:hypothetical protein